MRAQEGQEQDAGRGCRREALAGSGVVDVNALEGWLHKKAQRDSLFFGRSWGKRWFRLRPAGDDWRYKRIQPGTPAVLEWAESLEEIDGAKAEGNQMLVTFQLGEKMAADLKAFRDRKSVV